MLIRHSTPPDRDALYQVCVRTGDDGADASALYDDPHLLPAIYLGAYLEFCPQYCWTVDDAGTPVGYLVGTSDTAGFEQRCESDWWPELRRRYPLGSARPGSRDEAAIRMIHERPASDPALLADYPAHLHIDLLPITQGRGIGRQLIATFEATLTAHGVPGVHLGVSRSNHAAVGFYRHLGFAPLRESSHALVLGKRLE